MTTLLQDLRYAFRTLRKSPGFTAVAISTLALGIGANAAIFALVDRVLLTLLPVANPRQLVLFTSPGPMQGHIWSDDDDATSFPFPMYEELRDRNTVFRGLIAEFPFPASVSAGGQTDRASGELVSGNYFDLLGTPPAVGRSFTAGDDRVPGGHPVTILSYGYWSRRFGGDASVLNQTIVVNGHPLSVVGVARAGFDGIQPGRHADLFVPLMMKPQMTPTWNGLDDPKDYWIQIVGRLKPGVSPEQAEASLQSIYKPLLEALSKRMTISRDSTRREFLAKKIRLLPGGYGRAVLKNSIGTPLVSLMCMVGLVLMIACSNIAGLLAARGAARQREYGIRLAIGASRFQLIRQSVVECLLFAAAGGALGLVVASWTLRALVESFPPDADLRQVAAHIDPRVLLFAALATLVSALFFGIAPAWRAARLDPGRTLNGQGRSSGSPGADVLRFRQWLVTAQIALTLVLFVGAGLFSGSLRNLGRVNLGLRPDHVVGFSIAPDLNGYSPERSGALARNLTEAIAALPGVRSVSAAELSTLTGDDSGGNITLDGVDPKPGSSTHVLENWIGPSYFATLGISLVSGRDVSWKDDAGAPKVAVVNEAFVSRFAGGVSALGQRFRLGRGGQSRPPIEVVGVVKNSKASKVAEAVRPFIYLPYLQDENLGSLTVYVRSDGEPSRLVQSLRAAVARLDAQLPIFGVKTLDQQVKDSLVTQRVIVLLSASFAALAGLLAAIGIYGVLAFSVAQRRQEIGVRVALGADPASVRRMILTEIGRFLVIGGLIGLPAAYALARTARSLLYGIGAAEPSIFAVGVALLAAVSVAAAFPPAWRAGRTNAMEALRNE